VKTIINEQLQLHNIFQPILRVDQQLHATVDTYEMLMRNAADAFPGVDFLTSLTTTAGNQRWITVSQSSLDHVLNGHPHRKIYINIEPCQLGFDNVWHFLATIHQQYGDQVAIELTERRETVHSLAHLDDEIARLRQLGFELAIDDVCAGSNSYAFVARQLGTIRRIKLSLLLFKNEDRATSRRFVDAWLAFATKHHLDFVIEGIADRQIAQQFAGNPTILQQGFYWGKGAAEI
jgi:EAL domain-containing protein (putative c-di-GMP-specific phosphodiesterase class I)